MVKIAIDGKQAGQILGNNPPTLQPILGSFQVAHFSPPARRAEKGIRQQVVRRLARVV
jgi:hypothetical protein